MTLHPSVTLTSLCGSLGIAPARGTYGYEGLGGRQVLLRYTLALHFLLAFVTFAIAAALDVIITFCFFAVPTLGHIGLYQKYRRERQEKYFEEFDHLTSIF